MLDLVARLGGFGISVLMATHLLDDVQQVCDHVVMLDGGRLVVAGPTQDLLERSGVVVVDVDDHGPRLAKALAARKLAAHVNETGVVEVAVGGDDDLDVVRDVIADLGLPLHKLSTRVGTLDDVFLHRASGPASGAGPGPGPASGPG
jgi:ABC-2 type transport system ATP-binding protein